MKLTHRFQRFDAPHDGVAGPIPGIHMLIEIDNFSINEGTMENERGGRREELLSMYGYSVVLFFIGVVFEPNSLSEHKSHWKSEKQFE